MFSFFKRKAFLAVIGCGTTVAGIAASYKRIKADNKSTKPPDDSKSAKPTEDSKSAKPTENSKLFNDPVHGEILLHPLLVKIINTPEFQRLRFIKQLGGVYFVYPAAAHNRFEHSIGVCHLAGEFARKLKKCQETEKDLPENSRITDEDVLCVEVAALCHDLGHGPFSHLFDKLVIPEICKTSKIKEHEDISVTMFNHMYKKNKLEAEFRKAGLLKDCDFDDKVFITQLINRTNKEMDSIGRPSAKHFLYEIVSNKISGIDVDKWDYFARDCLMLGIKSFFSHRRAMECAKVLETKEDGFHICYRDKEVYNLYDMFSVRNMIHRKACQHRVTVAVELMIADAIIAASESNHADFKFKGEEKPLSMEEALEDMAAYQQITDEILMKIHQAEFYETTCKSQRIKQDEFKKAKRLVKRILRRDLYKHVGSKLFQGTEMFENCFKHSELKRIVKDELFEIVDREESLENKTEIKESIVVYPAAFTYGQGAKNPLQHVWFFDKNLREPPKKMSKEQISNFLPDIFYELKVMVYCRENKYKSDVERVFEYWKEMKDCQKLRLQLDKKKTDEITKDEEDIKEIRDRLPSNLQELEIEEDRKRRENNSKTRKEAAEKNQEAAEKEAQDDSTTK